jgi:hypothetical protein
MKETNVKNVMLVKSPFQQEQMESPVDSFSGIPMNADSPFVEIIWDPVRRTLAIISKIKKESFHFLPKLSGGGAPLPNNDKSSQAMMPYQQERILIETFHEYFIYDRADVERFLKTYAFNEDFDWTSFLDAKVPKQKK